MTDNGLSIEEFIAKTSDVLQSTEDSLQELAQIALSKYEQALASQDNGHGIPQDETSTVRLRKISQHLTNLSERSKVLQSYLQSERDASLIEDDQWPGIRILQSQEEERMHVARELEDNVGQLLANAVFELASCQQLLTNDKEAVSDGLGALQTELEQGLTDLRQFITELEPTTILGNFGLGGGVRRYLEQYEAKTGLQTQLHIRTNFGRLPTITEVAIFRVIQEALSNIHDHANATRVDVIFEEQDSMLQFKVIDNGGGLAPDKIGVSRRKLGLARMSDYAELLKGKLRILSEPEYGTQVILLVPYPAL